MQMWNDIRPASYGDENKKLLLIQIFMLKDDSRTNAGFNKKKNAFMYIKPASITQNIILKKIQFHPYNQVTL